MAEPIEINEALDALNSLVTASRPFTRLSEAIPAIEKAVRLVGEQQAIVGDLGRQADALKAQVADLEQQHEQKRAALDKLQSDFDAKLAAFNQSHDAKVKELTDAHVQQMADLQASHDKLSAQARDQLEAATRSAHEELAKVNADAKQKKQAVANELSALGQKRDDLASQVGQLETRWAALRQQVLEPQA